MDERPITPQEPHGTPFPGESLTPAQSEFSSGSVFEQSRETSGSVTEPPRGEQHRLTREELRSRALQARQRARAKAREQASRASQQTREYGRDVFCNQRDRAAGELNHFSGAIRDASSRLRAEKDDNIAHYLDVAASQVERVQNYVRACEPQQLYHDAQNTVRRHPALVMGGLFAAGFALARFLKASAEHYDEYTFQEEDYWDLGEEEAIGFSDHPRSAQQPPAFGQPT